MNKTPASSRKRLGARVLTRLTCDRASVSQSCRIASARVPVSERLYYHLYLPLCLEPIAPRSHLLACSQQDRLGIGRFATLHFNTLSLCLVDVQHSNSEEWLKMSPKLSKPISSGWSSITSWGKFHERWRAAGPLSSENPGCASFMIQKRGSRGTDQLYAHRFPGWRIARMHSEVRVACSSAKKKLQRLESDTSVLTTRDRIATTAGTRNLTPVRTMEGAARAKVRKFLRSIWGEFHDP